MDEPTWQELDSQAPFIDLGSNKERNLYDLCELLARLDRSRRVAEDPTAFPPAEGRGSLLRGKHALEERPAQRFLALFLRTAEDLAVHRGTQVSCASLAGELKALDLGEELEMFVTRVPYGEGVGCRVSAGPGRGWYSTLGWTPVSGDPPRYHYDGVTDYTEEGTPSE